MNRSKDLDVLDTSLPPPPDRPPRLLVVDDDEARRQQLERVLRYEGYHVDSLLDGTRVLDHVRERPPDLILLNVLLPGHCGFEVCGDLRMMDEARLTPVILFSPAQNDEESVVRGLLCGADDYIVDPKRIAELKARVRVQLRNRRDRELLQWARRQRASFRQAAMNDALTGIPNRRSGEHAISDALTSGDPVLLMMLDVDHFKQINDTWGHATGDATLRAVASTLDRLARKGDTVARFGGEEFLVVIRGAAPDLADRISERFRAGIEAMRLPCEAGPSHVTVSGGVATWPGGPGTPTAGQLLEAADEALYVAKRDGRNRVVIRHLANRDETSRRERVA